MRVCLVYDHLFPLAVGGAERWMRDLAVRLTASGHDVTYLTMRHWELSDTPEPPGVRVLGLTEPGQVYRDDRRSLGPPLRFGLAVARHLLRYGSSYDVVHLASFPYFPLLAAGALRRRGGYALVVDWHEVWTLDYWRRYAGTFTGSVGWLVQKACVKIPHTAHCLSRLHAQRLVDAGYKGKPAILPGLYSGPIEPTPGPRVDTALVVYAGRHVPEKRVHALVRGFVRAHERRPELRLELFGDGPERPRIEELARSLAASSSIRVHGRRPEEEVAAAIGRAACLATASEREGYGLVVVEAAARGTPSVVVAGPENAATELVRDGVNGSISHSASEDDIARALLAVIDGGAELRDSTARWFAAEAPRLTIAGSLDLVAEEYARHERAD